MTKPSFEAEYLLAVKYLSGVGVSKDLIEGFKLFRRAAEWGEVRAQYDLGVLYATGQGSPRDAVQAHVWFSLAASQGYRDSPAAVARLERDMSRDQITEARKLVNNGNLESECGLKE